MRDIKFRAWVGSENRMERDMFYINQWDGKCHYTQPYHYEHEDSVKIYDCGEEEPTLMQYTGLKDINGKEIYDGDILKKHYGSEKPYVFVAWCKERASFINNDGYNELLFQKSLYMCEIVGNIYENPELLNNELLVKECDASKADSSKKVG